MVKFAIFVAYNLQMSVLLPNGARGAPISCFFCPVWGAVLVVTGVIMATTEKTTQSVEKMYNTEEVLANFCQFSL